MFDSPSITPADPADSRLLFALRVFSLAIIALHLAAPLFGEANAWGLWSITYLPPIGRWLLAVAAALLCLPPVTSAATRAAWRSVAHVRPALGRWLRSPARRNLLFGFVALLAIIPFTLFAIVHTRWGDAYILVNGIAYPDPELRLTATWQAPLDLWLHVRLWDLASEPLGWTDAWPTYRMLSSLAGALYVYVLLQLAASIGRHWTEKLIIVGLLGTLGTMQLFFGYAENYSLAATGILIYLWLALETLSGRRALWQPALALAVTNALHPSTIVLDPALLYVAWTWVHQEAKGKGQNPQWLRAITQLAGPIIVIALGVIVLMTLSDHGLEMLATTDRPGGGDARWFVPLTRVTSRWEHYTMLSWAHLRDFLNEQILTAPVTLGGLVIVAISLFGRSRAAKQPDGIQTGTRSREDSGNPHLARGPQIKVWTGEILFLTLSTVLYLLFTWVWNPDYGGQRDWDLFSLAAIPSTLLLARLLALAFSRRDLLLQAGLMLTAVSALHTLAWIYQNTLPWEWL